MRWPALTRGRRVLLAAAGALLLLMLLAWLALPPWLKRTAEEQGSAWLGRQVTIAAVHVNPLKLSVAVDELVIAGPAAGAPPLLRLAYGEVNADIRSLWRRAPVVEAVELRSPVVHLTRVADGRYDFDDIVARLKPRRPASPDEPPPQFALYNLRLSGGEVQFDDKPKSRVHRLRAIELGLPFLSNMDDAVDVNVEPHLAFQLDDTAFDTGVQAKPFTHDRTGALTLKTGDIDLADWLAYLPADLPARPVAGQLALDLTLQFKAPVGAAPEVGLKGQVRAKQLRLNDAADSTLAELGALSAALVDVQPLRRQVSLGTLALEGLSVQAQRDAEGQINWLRALSASTAPAKPSTAGAAEKPWQLSLAKLSVKDGRVAWEDRAVRPVAQAGIEALQIELDGLRWPVTAGPAPAKLRAQGQLANPDARHSASAAAPPTPDWQLQGQWSAAGGQLRARGTAWPLAWAGSYLAPMLKPRLEGGLGFDANASWTGAPGEQPPIVKIASLQVDDLKAIEPGQKLAAVAWRKLLLSDAEIDAAQHRVVLGRLALDQPALRAQRDATGQIDLLQWPLAASSTQAAAAPGPSAQVDASPAWQVQLQELALDGGRVAWQDAAAAKGEVVALELPRLKLSLRDLRWPPPPKGVSPLSGEALVLASGGANASGKLKWQGQLGLQPLAWRGKLSVERFPIHAVAAYAGESSPVSVARAEAGWSGDVSASLLPEGLSLAMKGDARLTDFSVYPRGAMQSARADELLRWNSLELAGVQVAVEPGKVPRIVVGESRLTDFYAQLMVSEAGQFNLTQLGPPEPADAGAPVAAAPPVAAASANAAAAPSPVELAVGGVLLKNGRIDFSDHFVRPNYSAALSDLNGKLGAFRTGTREMATLELRGRVAGTAQLEVRGSLNPTAKPLAMDIQARATDLELAPLSPYAGKYAGYAIERGKLTMDVSYRIDADGRLDAKNQLVLNQLTFGDRIDSPDATKLPVLLAVALLKDRNGVIDLNLPIGGSLNDPQFSIGGLVVKLIVNLLSKALTAPFALLAGGGGDELSLVEFRPGTARMADNASTVIDKVARALADRPSLQMTVNGTADPQSEREAIQAAWLDERLIGERRKEMLRTGGPADAAIPAPSAWPAEERLRLVRRVYGDTKLPNKPRNVLGLAKDISGPEMEALLRASYVVNTDNARELALQRGLAVRAALIAKGLPSDRLFLAAPKLRASGEDDAHWTPRVQLSLGTP